MQLLFLNISKLGKLEIRDSGAVEKVLQSVSGLSSKGGVEPHKSSKLLGFTSEHLARSNQTAYWL
jgi:hypothetical protein